MPYLRMDDNMPENPKLERLSDRAFRIYVRGLCYSARHMTDGFVPRQLALRWGTIKRVGELLAAPPGDEPLWTEARGGYLIHDYLEWNDSRDSILDRRRRDSARKAGGIPHGLPLGVPGVGVGEGKEQEDAFARFWLAAPRRELQQASRVAFRTLVADGEVDADTLIAAMEAYARSVRGRERRWIATPLKWLEERRWTDEYEPARPPSPEDIAAEVQAFVAEGGAT